MDNESQLLLEGLVGRSGSHAHSHDSGRLQVTVSRSGITVMLPSSCCLLCSLSSPTLFQQPDSVTRTLQIFHRRDTVLVLPEKSPCFYDQYLYEDKGWLVSRTEQKCPEALSSSVELDTNLGGSTALKPNHEDAILASLTTNLRNSSPLSSKRPQ